MSVTPEMAARYELLGTKLFVPPPRPDLVERQRLLSQLAGGLRRKLTLISAPAGFGKTTLVSSWLGQSDLPVAWVSLDEGDDQLRRFLSYVVAALCSLPAAQAASAEGQAFGEGVLGMLHAPQPSPTTSILTALLNDLLAIQGDFALVLDDYHAIQDVAIDEALGFLVEHMPPHVHLVIATREDPVLPLARLRARRQLVELRAADLRFTSEEAALFLNQVMKLELSAEDIEILEQRTEGWIAGLQLAALSMEGRDDSAGFIRAFAGDHRYIVDYLLEEVLQRQSQETRDFLLQTSVLQRLCGGLCDAVTGDSDGRHRLEALERGNLFVVPLDETRHWFRYHHLFADVLQAHATKAFPDQLPVWHLRASQWFEAQGHTAEAIRHAFEGGDALRAAVLLELAWPELDGRFQSSLWLSWARQLPEALIQTRPVLACSVAWASISDGDMESGLALLDVVEQLLEEAPPGAQGEGDAAAHPHVVDLEQYRFLPATMETARAYATQAFGDLDGSVVHAEKALAYLPDDELLRRGPAAALLGLTYWARGQLEQAYQILVDGMHAFRQAGNPSFALSMAFALADIRLVQGRLRDATKVYEEGLRYAKEQGEPTGSADLYLGLGQMQLLRGDLEGARARLDESEGLGESLGLPDWRCRFYKVLSHLKEAEGDLDGALGLLDQAEGLYVRSPVPEARPFGALRARLWLKQGRLYDAVAWCREAGLSMKPGQEAEEGDAAAPRPSDFVQEFALMTLARVRLAEAQAADKSEDVDAIVAWLQGLAATAEAAGRRGHVLEITLILAQAYQATGRAADAEAAIVQALRIAAPEGYIQCFLDEGPQMAKLLVKAQVSEAPLRAYLDELGAAFAARRQAAAGAMPDDKASMLPRVRRASDAERSAPQPLIEPLSERELEVLELIAEGLSNKQICARLHLALSTVKGHNQNIFGKLQVRRRTEAVARARELGLV